MAVLQYPEQIVNRGRVAMPNAVIRVEQHDDGRFMWAHSFSTSQGGEGFRPMPKWNLFAGSEREAIEAAVAEFMGRLDQRHWSGNSQARELRAWAEELREPVQGGLFG